jgi:predicted lipase
MSPAKRLKDTPLSTPASQENSEENSATDPERKIFCEKTKTETLQPTPNLIRFRQQDLLNKYLLIPDFYFLLAKIPL